jgi:hypothetical protein
VISFHPLQSIAELAVKGINLPEEESLIDYTWCEHDKLVLLVKENKGILITSVIGFD